MRFGKIDWKTATRGEEHCFLLTNGLGGYSSLTITGANTRNDHALFMGVEMAPNCRYHYLTNIHEKLEMNENYIDLATQSYVTWSRNQAGYKYLQMFSMEDIAEWTYLIAGITVKKQLVMSHEKNKIALRYQIWAPKGTHAVFHAAPLMKFTLKDKQPERSQEYVVDEHSIKSAGKCLYFETNGRVKFLEEEWLSDLYFSYDARDGRDSVGTAVKNHELIFEIKEGFSEFEMIYSEEEITETFADIYEKECTRLRELEQCAGLKNPSAVRLVKSAAQFLVKRESTKGDSIIAGYPFFSDWGRDTMIALLGCGIETKQYARVKSVLRTFAGYCEKGLMPNLFPEGESEPMYNTVDAALWFVEAVYEYWKQTEDYSFREEMLPVMKEIVDWYEKGTDFHIFMDKDGLLSAGCGLEQVTWMDVRVGEILPTPRHGKPVEVNALWYNALCILKEFTGEERFSSMAEKTKKSFQEKFWLEEGYLKDVIVSGDGDAFCEKQLRCNQVWALSLPFSMVEKEQALCVLDVIEQNLYTPYGLRSLAPSDREFHPVCCGNQFDRDMAYHQGTVWGFPLGAYLLSLLKWKEGAEEIVKEKLHMFENTLREGCVGQVAEIFDGEDPCESRGCFAQAWSVGEMLRVYGELERRENNA